MSCKSLNETFDISMKTLENPIFPTSIKCSLLPRLDCFEGLNLYISEGYYLVQLLLFKSSLPHRLCECGTK